MPATGKTTVARGFAREIGAAFVRIDTIEQAVVGAGRAPVGPAGYEVGYGVAADQLRLGLDVVAECVNPTALSRDAWVGVGDQAGAAVVEVELVCADTVEHRRRAQSRTTDVPGLLLPTWQREQRITETACP